MESYWIDAAGKQHKVKNLGWLLRHAGDVRALHIGLPESEQAECHLEASLAGGRVYHCDFMSLVVCRDWIKRPVFRGIPVTETIEE